MYSLGISHVGAFIANLLAEEFWRYRQGPLRPGSKQLLQVQGIGEKVANALTAYFSNPDNRRLAHELLDIGFVIDNPPPTRPVETGFWSGKTVVFTGALSL